MHIKLDSIGTVVSPVKEPTDKNWGDVISKIFVKKEYSEGLIGLETFSHALIIYYMHLAIEKNRIKIRRRPQGRNDMPFIGIFSQRAKRRPNPIGVSAVEIVEVGKGFITVKGLDAIDQTPVLDIKPYYHRDRVESPIIPSWVKILLKDYF